MDANEMSPLWFSYPFCVSPTAAVHFSPSPSPILLSVSVRDETRPTAPPGGEVRAKRGV